MLVKPGVQLSGVHFFLWYAAAVWDYILTSNGFAEGTITGGREGADPYGPARVANTRHPGGYALDFRTRDLPQNVVESVVDVLREFLGPTFHVVLEVDHVHVELVRPPQRA